MGSKAGLASADSVLTTAEDGLLYPQQLLLRSKRLDHSSISVNSAVKQRYGWVLRLAGWPRSAGLPRAARVQA